MAMNVGGGGVTSTDAEGRYEIKDLPAGRYSISATKSGYVTGQYGQRRPTEPGTPIEIADGMAADKLNFTLARGGVIAGHVLDDNGEPIAGVQVAAMRYGFQGGTRRLIGSGSEGGNDRTDDQGGFRLFGLTPGDYYISASYRSMMMMGPEIEQHAGRRVCADIFSRHTQCLGSAARLAEGGAGNLRHQLLVDS